VAQLTEALQVGVNFDNVNLHLARRYWQCVGEGGLEFVSQAVPSFEPTGLGYGNEIFGAPRFYGVRAKYRFGAASH
jgi:hypothetical protein